MEKIKLVIWDLDETFWTGTLSEEGVVPSEANIQLVKSLTDRGIINSIASKNDFEVAEKKLTELGIWDHFVFPAIAWKPKGELVKQIIERCQLRAPNVLFLDDNHLNLEEVKFYNEGIHTHMPDFIPEISGHAAFKGKDDSSHSRLKQYKILENKFVESLSYSDNTAFLKQSEIRLSISDVAEQDFDRVYELIERTNQLNFTKIRSSHEELKALLSDPDFDCKLVEVKDKFGEYGKVGFYALDKKEASLLHFIFSCRIINLGVEHYILSKLGFPKLEIIEPVSAELSQDRTNVPDWIEEVSSWEEQSSNHGGEKLKLLIKGGCDMSQSMHYVKNDSIDIIEEYNFVDADNFSIRNEHSECLMSFIRQDFKDHAEVYDLFPFVQSPEGTGFFNKDLDCLVYSTLMDYTQDIYVHKSTGLRLPYGSTTDKLNYADDASRSAILERFEKRKIGLKPEQLELINSAFENTGHISPDEFIANLSAINESLGNKKFIVINGGESLIGDSELAKTELERHREMNQALDKFVSAHDNVELIDLRELFADNKYYRDNIRHYTREGYRLIGQRIADKLEVDISQSFSARMERFKSDVYLTLKHNYRRLRKSIKS